MTDNNEIIDEIEAMARHEEAIAALYNAFAENIEGWVEFWNDISLEELGHASLVREFRLKVDEGIAQINKGRFRIEPIKKSIKYVEAQAEKARQGWLTDFTALVAALDIENALLEKNFLEVFDTDDEELKTLLNNLQISTTDHKTRIEKALESVRHQPGAG